MRQTPSFTHTTNNQAQVIYTHIPTIHSKYWLLLWYKLVQAHSQSALQGALRGVTHSLLLQPCAAVLRHPSCLLPLHSGPTLQKPHWGASSADSTAGHRWHCQRHAKPQVQTQPHLQETPPHAAHCCCHCCCHSSGKQPGPCLPVPKTAHVLVCGCEEA